MINDKSVMELLPNAETSLGPSRRILIADDNADAAVTWQLLLELAGHEVFVVHNGKEALDIARQRRPQIAVLDIGMPGLSGYDVARHIRHEAWGTKMKLIAVTGWGRDDDKRMASAAGFDLHLTKPVDPDQLMEIVGAN